MLRYLLPLFGEAAFATRNNYCQTPLDAALENEHELCSEILRTVTSMYVLCEATRHFLLYPQEEKHLQKRPLTNKSIKESLVDRME